MQGLSGFSRASSHSITNAHGGVPSSQAQHPQTHQGHQRRELQGSGTKPQRSKSNAFGTLNAANSGLNQDGSQPLQIVASQINAQGLA